jgi:hypothetical protein
VPSLHSALPELIGVRVKISRATRRSGWFVMGALLSVIGCGPIVDKAPFTFRADSLTPGDLLGPFDGMVVDAETDRPIAGAVVTGSWAFERGIGLVGPAGATEVVTETGADGRYRLPRLENLPSGASMRVRRFTLIVYQRGYIGWRSDRRFPAGSTRRDFAQRGNRARLEKWRDGLFHHQHLVFLGGGPAIRAASQAEVQPAVFELDGRTGGVGARMSPADGATAGAEVVPLDASPLLNEDEIRATTGYAGEFDVSRLTDLPRTEFYDSQHFKARGQTEKYDVGLRVWRLGESGAEAQYRKLMGQLPGATPVDEIGDASLRARQGDLLGVAFLVRSRGIVVAITCGTSQCSDAATVARLAKLIESRLPELLPQPAQPSGSSPAAPAPEPTPAAAGTGAPAQSQPGQPAPAQPTPAGPAPAKEPAP